MTQMNRQQFDNYTFQKPDNRPDKERAEKLDTRRFWCLYLPAGVLAGFFGCVVGNSGAYFVPVGGVVVFLLWAAFGRSSG